MLASTTHAISDSADTGSAPYVIVGDGPVGIRLANELLKRDPGARIVLYGNEPFEPYNRVRLSNFLAGTIDWESLRNTIQLPVEADVIRRQQSAIVAIDRKAKTVTDIHGQVQPYFRLVLATGSSAHVPCIEGIGKKGIFTFRNLRDAEWLLARRTRSRHTLVLGGGLLGLETARAMQRLNTQVTIIEHGLHLMPQQLDEAAASLLHEHVLTLGIRVITGVGVKAIQGEDSVESVLLHNGQVLSCDTIILSTGIRPNVQLALEAGLSIGRGVRVNDYMQTSDADIYAVGECAEHRGRIYGVVAPGLEQAAVAAHHILRGRSRYRGSVVAARLKVIDQQVFSMGAAAEADDPAGQRSLLFSRPGRGLYRRLILQRGRLVGAVALGDWPDIARLQEAVSRQRFLWPWQIRRFVRTGSPWRPQSNEHISYWSASTVICNCMGVNRGRLSEAMTAGCATVQALQQETAAGTVCGSCRPLLAQLVGESLSIDADRTRRPLGLTSVTALLLAIAVVLLTPIPFAQSMATDWNWDVLWRDGFWKQVSGFSLLGLSLVTLLLSLRKRWKRFTLGDYPAWRLAHAVVGVLILAVLVAHTGFRFGYNLNAWLMTSFVAALVLGAGAGLVAGLQSSLRPSLARRLTNGWNWLHIVLLWPVPVLLGFHIVSVYYF